MNTKTIQDTVTNWAQSHGLQFSVEVLPKHPAKIDLQAISNTEGDVEGICLSVENPSLKIWIQRHEDYKIIFRYFEGQPGVLAMNVGHVDSDESFLKEVTAFCEEQYLKSI